VRLTLCSQKKKEIERKSLRETIVPGNKEGGGSLQELRGHTCLGWGVQKKKHREKKNLLEARKQEGNWAGKSRACTKKDSEFVIRPSFNPEREKRNQGPRTAEREYQTLKPSLPSLGGCPRKKGGVRGLVPLNSSGHVVPSNLGRTVRTN